MPESWRGGGAQATRRIAPVVSRLPFPARSEPRANDSHLAATSRRPACAPSPDWSIDHRTLHSMLCPEMAFTVNGSNGRQRVNKWLMQWLKRLGPIVPREATDAAKFGNLRESVPDSYALPNSSTMSDLRSGTPSEAMTARGTSPKR